MLKIGVVGAGHLGKIHIKCIKNIPNYELVGFYDINKEVCREVEREFGIKAFESIDELINSVEVVDIVTPTVAHYECAVKAIKKFRHVFIEKPIVTTLEEARMLMKLSKEADVQIQVGHVERFNPAFLSVKDEIHYPLFIEAHRLSMFNPRGLDVPVVLDLMIHDIDIVLSIVKSKVKRILASGVPIVSSSADIANARIEFENGCVANLTASRISMKNMRKIRFFQPNQYISVDLLNKKSEIISLKNYDDETARNPFAMVFEVGETKKEVVIRNPKIPELNAIQTELEYFYQSIVNKEEPVVSLADGYAALDLAHKIMNKIQKKLDFFM